MRWANSIFFIVFAVSAAVVLFYAWAFRARDAALKRFAEAGLAQKLTRALDQRRRKVKVLFRICAVIFALVALMRPQWGFHWQEVMRRGVDIIIAMDTSKSMLAQDIKPNRLSRARLAVRDFVRELGGDRIGLIAFAGRAFLQCPLTADYGGFLLTLDSLDVHAIPRGGTSLESAITEAIRSFANTPKKYKVLVLITDGESFEGDALRAARQAKEEGIIIHCIGVGTTEGELILTGEAGGQGGFLKDSAGNVIKSRLDENSLRQIAFTAGGSYARATATEFGLDALYRGKIAGMEKREYGSRLAQQYEERFQIPLAAAIVLLIIEALLSDAKKYTYGMICALVMLWRIPGAQAADEASMIKKGNTLYGRGRFEDAGKAYEEALSRAPGSAVLNFNAGVSRVKTNNFPAAQAAFEKALLSGDKALEAKTRYNIANTKYYSARKEEDAGNLAGAAGFMRQSLEYYKRALDVDPRDTDAKFNHEFVQRELKVLEEKLQEQCSRHTRENSRQQNEQSGGGQQRAQDQSAAQQQQQETPSQASEQERNDKKASSNGGDREQPSAKSSEKNQDGAPASSLDGAQESPQEMSEQEARMLLEGYQQESGSAGMIRDTDQRQEAPVAKDW